MDSYIPDNIFLVFDYSDVLLDILVRGILIILGDFNKSNLSCELPKYKQHISCPTRDSNILDHCYTAIKDAYHSVPWAALGLSDHCLVHLIPTYRQKLKSAKPVLRTVKRSVLGSN